MKLSIRNILIVTIVALVGTGLILAVVMNQRMVRRKVESVVAHIGGIEHAAFPVIDESSLSDTQKKIINISRQEYDKKPMSYDDNVLKYSNGVVEPWCADYVSWVMREAGRPFVNPNSGGWRIPGVLTLREYYKATNRFKDAREYTPKTGDVAIYVNTTSFNTSRQHTSIVLKVDGDKVTTIGGNERGRLRVTTQTLTYGTKGLVGYGTLQ